MIPVNKKIDRMIDKHFAKRKIKTKKLLINPNKKFLKVMPDFCSSGIWEGRMRGGEMIDYDELPRLPKEIIKHFESWIDFYDVFCHEHKNYTFIKNKYREFLLNYWGLNLARELKIVYPEYRITYVGETSKGINKPIEVK